MVKAFVAEIAESLLGKSSSFAVQESCSARGLGADLGHLEERLSAIITPVLSDVEKQQSQNGKIRIWLQKLREALYDAEDILDESECGQLVKTEGGSTSRKVQRFFSSSNKLAFRFKMGHRVKNRLSEVESLKFDFKPFFESFTGLIGRDEDRESIIDLLEETFKVDDAYLFVIPVSGVGGLGKTVNVKSVSDGVNTHFELEMQACVSDGFVLKQVLPKLVKSVSGESSNDLGDGGLKAKPEGVMNGMKYLLVLDDVWNEELLKWLLLKPLLSVLEVKS